MLGRKEKMPSNHEINTERIRKTSTKRDMETFQRIDKTIQYLIKTGQEINFKSVSEQAGVSKAYLYLHQNIRELIETIMKKQETASSELTAEKVNSHAYEYYATPEWAVRRLLEHRRLHGHILDPTAGSGAILKAIRNFGYENPMTAVEIRREEEEKLQEFGSVFITDFLNWQPDQKYDTIITNPPFNIAKEIIMKCHEIRSEKGQIIMLLKTAHLETGDRYNFWQKYPVSYLYALSERPYFEGDNETDQAAYAWYVWDGTEGTIKVI
jgi:methylase of polypeptide subunit release factors